LSDAAQGDEGWFTAMLRASETGLIAEKELADARKVVWRIDSEEIVSSPCAITPCKQ
jgi:hypothetical protein